jgi:hypothetical protein
MSVRTCVAEATVVLEVKPSIVFFNWLGWVTRSLARAQPRSPASGDLDIALRPVYRCGLSAWRQGGSEMPQERAKKYYQHPVHSCTYQQ